MANTLNNTINKIADTVKAFNDLNKNVPIPNGITNLERVAMEARREHLMRNEWRRDLGYSKPLVDAEYLIQSEFKVSSFEDRLYEKDAERLQKKADKAEKKAKKAQEKADKADEKKRKILL